MKQTFTTLLLCLLLFSGCKTPVPTITQKHEQELQREVVVAVPKVYELLQVALSLTETFQADQNLVNKNTAYYQDRISHFGPYSTHPLVLKLDKQLKKSGPYGYMHTFIRFQTLNYELENGRLVEQQRYSIPLVYSLAPLFLLRDNEKLLQSFATVSNFEAFYNRQSSYFNSLVSRSHELCDYTGMWQWLEREFPGVKYDAYAVHYSPLTGGFHNTSRYKSKDGSKKQTLMFVNAPLYEGDYWKDRPFLEKSASASRIVFTEIDHNYVNPTTDLYISQMEEAMGDLKLWNNGKATGGYNTHYLTFNEYMTWAVFTLYLYDTYPPETFEVANAREADFMIRRGFPKFKEFNSQLLQLYQHKQPQQTVADLYPAILSWMKQQQVLTQNTIQK